MFGLEEEAENTQTPPGQNQATAVETPRLRETAVVRPLTYDFQNESLHIVEALLVLAHT